MFSLPSKSDRFRVILGCTGSVASIKVPELSRKMSHKGADVIIVTTDYACNFLYAQAQMNVKSDVSEQPILSDAEIGQDIFLQENNMSCTTSDYKCVKLCNDHRQCVQQVRRLYPDLTILCDKDEWSCWTKIGDPVLHIALREWAQILVLAPLDANTLAKVSHGICDNFLTSIVRAWDLSRPVVFCPAMNTHMYMHPFTVQQISILKGFGFSEVAVVTKKLACGDLGPGAMAEVDSIVDKTFQHLNEFNVNCGQR